MFKFPKLKASRNNCFGIGVNLSIMLGWSTDPRTCRPQPAALSTHRQFSFLIGYLEIYLEVILQWASFHECVVLVRLNKTLDVGDFKLSEKERNELFWIYLFICWKVKSPWLSWWPRRLFCLLSVRLKILKKSTVRQFWQLPDSNLICWASLKRFYGEKLSNNDSKRL